MCPRNSKLWVFVWLQYTRSTGPQNGGDERLPMYNNMGKSISDTCQSRKSERREMFSQNHLLVCVVVRRRSTTTLQDIFSKRTNTFNGFLKIRNTQSRVSYDTHSNTTKVHDSFSCNTDWRTYTLDKINVQMPKKADTAMKIFVIGCLGLTTYGAFALTNSLYQLKQFNTKYNEENEKNKK